MIFEKEETDWEQFVYFFFFNLRVGYWMKGWCANCPYSPSDVAYNLDCIRGWSLARKKRDSIQWIPPSIQFLEMECGWIVER